MNLVLKTPNEPPYKPGKDFSVVMSCGDATVARACEILQRLNHNLENEKGRLLYQLWNIEVLAFVELRELGAIEAAAADMIIVGLPGGRELPGTVAAWMKRWLELRKGRPGALVGVLEADVAAAAAQGTLAQLKAAAAAGQMDFFATGGGSRVGRDAGMVRGLDEAARHFVMAHRHGAPGGLPGGRRLPATACGS